MASEELGMAKSGVSRHVSQLESHFGVSLAGRARDQCVSRRWDASSTTASARSLPRSTSSKTSREKKALAFPAKLPLRQRQSSEV